MRSVAVCTNVPTTELNHHNCRVVLKEVRNGTRFDGQGLSEEDESRINEDVRHGHHHVVGLVRTTHEPQVQVVQWDRFLPLRSLKVLLVEDDDSTRHVVSALLRNCSYEVTAVANSLEAWKLLIDTNKPIDLVLTEVVMPYLSGIGLLSRITNHAIRKNLPVIMMSSDDSMGIVFSCLSKGAVDFLVKPIRKNELKNLWQHVWRKCHSSSGSGSGSIRDHKSTKSTSIQGSDNDSDTSNEDDDDISIELNAKGGSDNGSDTHSPWPKRSVEVDSSQAKSLGDKLPNPHDVTCAPLPRPEIPENHWRSTVLSREDLTENDKLEIIEMGKDLNIGVPKSSICEVKDTNKKLMDKFCESNLKKVGDKLDIGMQIGCQNGAPRTEPLGPTKISNAHTEALKANNLLKNINIEEKSIYSSKESPALELTLKRSRDVEDVDASAQERNVLRHSGISAFSRYNTAANNNQAPTGNVGSCSPFNISSEAAKADNINSNSPNQRSNGSDDMGSTTNNAFKTKPADDKQLPTNSTIAVQPLVSTIIEDGDGVITTAGKKFQVRHHHHHYHHHHHHVHKQKMVDPEDGSLRYMVSNILTASAEGNAANYGSASGSNNKSNGENGGSWQKCNRPAPVVEGGKNETNNVVAKKDNGVARKSNAGDVGGNGNGSGSGSGSGVDQGRLTQRQAALNKFRQKRKERCFEKKVRYQSRKKLAEQRPRIRGQFVRHVPNGVNNEDADS